LNRGMVPVILVLAVAVLGFTTVVTAVTTADDSSVIKVNVTNSTVYVSFQNFTTVNFTTTHITLGWLNETHIISSYTCLYAYSVDECHNVTVRVYDGTVLKYVAVFDNKTELCTLNGICHGVAVFNTTGFSGDVNVYVIDNSTGETSGPYRFVFPYQGPVLTGYAQYITILVPFGVLISLAGRMGMKNVGIGLFIYGVIAPVLVTLGVSLHNIMLVSTLSIIMGVILIWMSNQ